MAIPTKIASNTGGAVSSLVLTLTGTAAAGDMVHVDVFHDGASTITISVADSRSNTYQQDIYTSVSGGSTVHCAQFSSILTTALQVGDTITITYSSSSTGSTAGLAYQVSGIVGSSWKDQSLGTALQANGTTPSSGNVTTTQASEIIFGVLAHDSTATTTAGTNFTKLDELFPVSNRALFVEYRIVAATGTYAATATFSGSSAARTTIATYKIAAVTSAKTGALVSSSASGGADARTAAETGALASSSVAAGADVRAAAETGALTAVALQSGQDADSASETGSLAAGALLAGADAQAASETGAVAAGAVTSGADAATFTEAGAAVASARASAADALTAAEAGSLLAGGLMSGVYVVAEFLVPNVRGGLVVTDSGAVAAVVVTAASARVVLLTADAYALSVADDQGGGDAAVDDETVVGLVVSEV